MKNLSRIIICALAMTALCSLSFTADAGKPRKKQAAEQPAPVVKVTTNDKGYYKDLFFDSGIGLNTRDDHPSARFAGISFEYFRTVDATGVLSQIDTIKQNEMIVGSAQDENGVLLYPDGAPRFRVIFVHGGNSRGHGASLGEAGRDRLREFYEAGGSYVGTCAGALFCSTGYDKYDVYKNYLHIFPGHVTHTGMSKTATEITIEEGSPLLRYYDYGGDMQVDSVRHNGGCYMNDDEKYPMPEGTEVLARYMCKDDLNGKVVDNDGRVACWAYKASETSGRLVVIGSHPEDMTGGDRLQLMSAMERYAMDGNGPARVKAQLNLGENRRMVCSTHDANPEFTKIGDRQYHHFTVDVPEGLDTLTISLSSLKGNSDYDLFIFANPGDFAFRENALFQNIALGMDKVLKIPAPKPGIFYISIFCDTTVESSRSMNGTQYSGRVDVLNGVPYVIGVNSSKETSSGGDEVQAKPM